MISDPTVLVPIDASGPTEPAADLVNLLEPVRIVVLGYYPVPDQASLDQFQQEYEDDAEAAMEPVVRQFARQGTEVESALVFTRDRIQSIDRVANEHDCDAVVIPGTIKSLSHVLVSLKDEMNIFRVLDMVSLLIEQSDPEVTLFHADSIEKGSAKSELYLRGATDWLRERGLPRERITWKEPTEKTQDSDLLDLAEQHDFVITGEYDPELRDQVVGDIPTRIKDRTGNPVLIVRKERR